MTEYMQKFASILQRVEQDPRIQPYEKEVITRYGALFAPQNIPELSADDFKSFLLFRNNHHWSGIFRSENMLTEDMDRLRDALSILLDESRPLTDRLNQLFPVKGPNYIRGLGKAIATPILFVVYPDKYGVWNAPSEQALKLLGLFPNVKAGQSFAVKYGAVNQVLHELCEQHNTNLWKLDAALGELVNAGPSFLETNGDELMVETAEAVEAQDETEFGLESHLEDFIIENWERTKQFQAFELLIEDGDIVSKQYRTDVGPIDILARNKQTGDWLVIELKKGKTSDKVVGQILRYMGWVKKHKCAEGKQVSGLVIAKDKDSKLRYALEMVESVSMMTYQVDFHLSSVESE